MDEEKSPPRPPQWMEQRTKIVLWAPRGRMYRIFGKFYAFISFSKHDYVYVVLNEGGGRSCNVLSIIKSPMRRISFPEYSLGSWNLAMASMAASIRFAT